MQFREGNHIRETESDVKLIEEYLMKIEGVEQVSSAIGGGHPRFILTYDTPVEAADQYSNILVTMNDYQSIDAIQQKAQHDLEELLPDAVVNVKKFNLGPALGGKLQLRINGPDPEVIREMAEQAMSIMRDEAAKAVRTEWGAKIKVPQPVLAEDRGMSLGITRPMLATAMQANFSGTTTGLYREGIDLIPIIARAPLHERSSIEDIEELQIFSPTAGKNVPVMQVMNGVETDWENARVSRWHRRPMIKVHADPRTELPAQLFERAKPRIEQLLGVDVTASRVC